MIGRKISHFRVVEKLGGGGMGVVYKAQDERLPREVALKFLPPYLADSEEDRVRLEREASAASALDHPNICTIHEIDETEDGQLFIAMAFYEGETLKKKIEAGTLSMDESTRIALQAAEGLAAAHHLGIIHRDIKPANLMITDDGTVKIVDFGLAKREGQTKITRTNAVLGTPIYMSPEQLRGEEVDRRSDVWSLGVVLFQMLSGELPFTTDYDQAAVYSILNTDPESISDHVDDVPDPLHRILATALARDPDARYQDAGEMALALRKMREELGLATASTIETEIWRPEPDPQPLISWQRVAATVAVLALALGVAGWLTLRQWSGPDPPISDQEAQNLFDQARNYGRQGYTPAKLDAAEDLFRRAQDKEPGNPEIQAGLAELLARKQLQYPSPERESEILELADLALASDPELTSAWIARGRVELLQGNTDSAEEAARRAVELSPDDHRGLVLLGEVLLKQGKAEQGLETLEASVAIGDGYIWGREALGYALMRRGEYDLAAGQFEAVLKYAPDSPTALNNLAVIYFYQNRYGDALPVLNHLFRLEPEDDVVASNLGVAYFFLNRMEEAIEAFRTAHELAPTKPDHFVSLAETHEQMGEGELASQWYADAVPVYEKALAAKPNDEWMIAQRAFSAAKLGDSTEATQRIEAALSLAPLDPEILFSAARVYALIGNRERTFNLIQLALDAGYYRGGFYTDPSFSTFQDDPQFRGILDGTLESP